MNLALLSLSLLTLPLTIFAPKNAASDDTFTLSADELRTMITLRGREFQNSGDIVMDWSGSGFEFEVEGSTFIDASFKSTTGKIAVEIDGGAATRIFLRGESSTRIATNLSLGEKHTVKVYKDNEAGGALCALSSLTLEEGAKLYKTPKKKMKFDFLGASITCANQIDHDKGISAYGGYARQLSDMFDADFHSTCISGRGLMEGYNSESGWAGKNTDQLKEVYFTSSFFRDKTKQYDLKEYDPDLIVLNVGDNDLGKNIMALYNTTIESYLQEVETFHHKVRQAYPRAYILYMYGTYQNRWYSQEYKAKVESLNKEDGLTGFYYMPFLADGADDHPSERQHRQIATRLANHLYEELGWETSTSLQYEDTRFEIEDIDRIGFPAGLNPVNETEDIHASEWKSVRAVNATSVVDDPEDISLVGHNLKIFTTEFNVSKEKAGKHVFSLGYQANDYDQYCYVKIDEEGEWVKVDLPKTQQNTTWESKEAVFDLSSGAHEIFITGPNALASSDRYDYFYLQPLTPMFSPKEEGEGGQGSELTPMPSKGGCASSIVGGSVALSLVFLGGAVYLIKRRKNS